MLKRATLQVEHLRTIRSFVAREGRITAGQKQLLEEQWPWFGLSLEPKILDLPQIFGRIAPLTLEIGFGDGRSLLAMAQENPHLDFIGIEVYRCGIAKLLAGIKQTGVKNIRIFCADAHEVLENCIPDACLQQVQLFFPDPWPKAKHHKRRIVQRQFIDLVAKKLVSAGVLHMATDWQDYADHMLSIMTQQSGWMNTAGKNNFALRPNTRPLTKFEQRGQRLGYGTWDIIFRKCHNI